MFGFHIPHLRATQSIDAVEIPTTTGRLSAGVALVVAIVGTTLLTIVAAQLAR
jgi:hypothetical protein